MANFRFGVQLSAASNAKEWVAIAQRIESLHYSSIMVPDHFDSQLSPISALSFAAAATKEVNVGTLVASNDYRHPVVLAREVATLAALSGGRVELGIGAGWLKADYDSSGLVLDHPGIRVARLKESVEIMRSMFLGERIDFDGEYYKVHGSTAYPELPEEHRPRLTIGGGGKKVLDLAARYADVVGVNPNLSFGAVGVELLVEAAPERFDEKVTHVRERLGYYGRSAELQCLSFVCEVVNDRKSWISGAAAAFSVDADAVSGLPIVLVGSVEQLIDQLETSRERYGFSYWVIHQKEIEAFAPVVEALSGR